MNESNIPGYTRYFISAEGKVFNIKTGRELKSDKYNYTLTSAEGERARIPLKTLYKLVYNKVYCIDNIEDLEGEEWKEIEESQGIYYISNYGRVKTYTEYTAKLIKTYFNSNYEKVKLVINNAVITSFIHRLVAEYWLEPPKSKDMIIHHINGDSRNNRYTNLIWVTPLQHTIIHNIINKKRRFLTAEETKNIIEQLEKGELNKYENY